jgi:hypothetical protein
MPQRDLGKSHLNLPMSHDLHSQLQDREASYARHFSALATLHLVWRQVAPEDRLRFLVEMTTPAERRAIAFGLEEDDV